MSRNEAKPQRHQRDTTAEAAAVQIEVMCAVLASRRMQMALDMSEELAEFASAGERARSRAARTD